MKLIVRLSKSNVTTAQLLKPGHGLHGPVQNWGNINGASLYFGTAYSDTPPWVNFIQSGTPSQITNLNNRGAVGILFVPVRGRYVIYTFGHTIKKLSASGFERDFGLKVVLNTVDPDKIKSVDSKLIDTVIVNKRTQLSKENNIEGFGFEINKDLLRALVGKPNDENFASLVAGSDTLSISCDITHRTLRRKSIEIHNAYNSSRYRTHYRWFDNIQPIKDELLITTLDSQMLVELNSVLAGVQHASFQLASPGILDFENVNHFRFRGYRSTTKFDLPEFDDLIADLLNKGITNLTEANLINYRVDSIDGNGIQIGKDSMYNWLIAEIRLGQDSYILSEGQWFKVSRRYYNNIQQKFATILNSRTEFDKIGTTTYSNEASYLDNYAATPQEKIFDKALSYIYGNRNSIEICDIYNIRRQFIHVKDGGASSKLSHLFNQGYVSAITFLSDPQFQRDIRNKLRTKPQLQATISTPIIPRSFTVIFRILKKGPILDLPFFTKVVIEEVYRKIKNLGYKFKLEWVEKV